MSTHRLTLRQLLTVPYVVLVVLAAAVIGLLSYRAGSEAVDTLSDIALNETVERIAQAVDRHISGSEAVLETAFPSDVPGPRSVDAELDRLRERLWLATSIHRDPNNYAYYGNTQGQFIGLWRHSETEAELRLRTEPGSPRSIHRFTRIRGELEDPVVESRVFDPRLRPWFQAGQGAPGQTWTSIYIDFRTQQLVGTRARRVDDADGQLEGVVATDMSLRHLNDFLKTLTLTENGVAFIVERNGDLLATSRGPHLRLEAGEENRRLNAARSEDPLVASTYAAVRGFVRAGDAASGTRTGAFEGPDGATVQAGYARLQDAAGLDWIVAVATPREDYMHSVTENVRRTALMAVLACALIALIGWFVLNRIAGELRALARAASRMGDGDLTASVPSDRPDEIGELARAFSDLQDRLLTDRLTGIANREALTRKLEDRIVHHRRRRDARPFALLFVDLDRFKPINDRFGHEIGDRVLAEVSLRLERSVRERDMAARFGGDEFVVLIDEVEHRSDAIAVAEKLRAVLARPYEALMEVTEEAARYSRGASVGVALYPEDGRDVETLLRRADERMYTRKSGSTVPAAELS